MRNSAFIFFLLAAFTGFTSIGKTQLIATEAPVPAPASASMAPLPASHPFPFQLGEATIYLELALLRHEQSRGLMHRKELKPEHGMLFVFRKPQRMSFWMKNTFVELDIGYFDPKGALMEVYPLVPLDTTPVKSISGDIQFALEMPRGWFEANQVEPGVQLDLDTLRAAIHARGFLPTMFGLSNDSPPSLKGTP
jgi:uncharacterized membrane protein (UPF0127 family)